MKILNSTQIRDADAHTILHEPISSLKLMERASQAFVHWFTQVFPDPNTPVYILAGMGNNGGDGLAVARLLYFQSYEVHIWLCQIGDKRTPDNQANLDRIPDFESIPITPIHEKSKFPEIPGDSIVIDALLGIGINQPVEGKWASLLEYINELPVHRVALDIASGLFPDKPTDLNSAVFKAHNTCTFQVPKLAFFFPENYPFVGEWHVQPIGLSPDFLASAVSTSHYIDEKIVCPLWKGREKFSHKGNFGHALLIAGGHGMTGAAILAAKATLRSGAGLLTVHLPVSGYEIMQMSVPEAMVSLDRHRYYTSDIPALDKYNVVGIGCGLNRAESTEKAISELLDTCTKSLVIDADAITILAGWIQNNSDRTLHKTVNNQERAVIITPHPGEFARLVGNTENSFERLERQKAFSKQHGVYVVLKGAHSCITTPGGEVFFNATGNPGMATAGSGDVLTGILVGLLAQGYSPQAASILGVYAHGLAGDIASESLGHEALLASDIIQHLGTAFTKVKLGAHGKNKK